MYINNIKKFLLIVLCILILIVLARIVIIKFGVEEGDSSAAKVESLLLDEKWKESTYKKITNAQTEGLFYDYILNDSKESDINETLRLAEIYILLNESIPQKMYNFIDKVKLEDDIILEMKRDFVLKNTKDTSVTLLKQIINDTRTEDREKIAQLFLLLKYTQLNNEESENILGEYLGEVDPIILEISNNELGVLYEYTYLASIIDFTSSLKIDNYNQSLIKELNTQTPDLGRIFYLQGIHYFLNSDNRLKDLKGNLQEYLLDYLTYGTPSTVDLFIIATINDNLGIDDILVEQHLLAYVKDNVREFSTEDGGITVKRDFTPTLGSDLLARVNLHLLGYDMTPTNVEDYLLLGNVSDWRIKILSYVYFDGTENYNKLLKKDIAIYNDKLESLKVKDSNTKSSVLENIYFITTFYRYSNINMENEQLNLYKTVLHEIFSDFVQLNSTDQRYLIDSMEHLNISYDKNFVLNEIMNYFVEPQGIFQRDGREDILLNYDYTHLLAILQEPGTISLETMKRFSNDTGGFNTLINEPKSSSLITTYYGLLYYKTHS